MCLDPSPARRTGAGTVPIGRNFSVTGGNLRRLRHTPWPVDHTSVRIPNVRSPTGRPNGDFRPCSETLRSTERRLDSVLRHATLSRRYPGSGEFLTHYRRNGACLVLLWSVSGSVPYRRPYVPTYRAPERNSPKALQSESSGRYAPCEALSRQIPGTAPGERASHHGACSGIPNVSRLHRAQW